MPSKKSFSNWNTNLKPHKEKCPVINGKSVSYAQRLSNSSTETGVHTITKNKRGRQ